MLDVPAVEQVIAVPKISFDRVPQRSAFRRPQKAEQLVKCRRTPDTHSLPCRPGAEGSSGNGGADRGQSSS